MEDFTYSVDYHPMDSIHGTTFPKYFVCLVHEDNEFGRYFNFLPKDGGLAFIDQSYFKCKKIEQRYKYPTFEITVVPTKGKNKRYI